MAGVEDRAVRRAVEAMQALIGPLVERLAALEALQQVTADAVQRVAAVDVREHRVKRDVDGRVVSVTTATTGVSVV